jgi:RNA polymerase sigma-70 factor (ECF subfamily)
MMEESDAALVTRARDGDSDAFRVLVERYSVRLFQLAYRMTGNQQDAEDIVQETFLKAFRQLTRFESRSAFGTWLHRIAANCAIDSLRRRRPDDQSMECEPADPDVLPSLATGPDQSCFHSELRVTLEGALQRLTAMERASFVLRHYEGRSIEEISQILRVSPNSTKQGIFRAVQKLRRVLQPLTNALP